MGTPPPRVPYDTPHAPGRFVSNIFRAAPLLLGPDDLVDVMRRENEPLVVQLNLHRICRVEGGWRHGDMLHAHAWIKRTNFQKKALTWYGATTSGGQLSSLYISLTMLPAAHPVTGSSPIRHCTRAPSPKRKFPNSLPAFTSF